MSVVLNLNKLQNFVAKIAQILLVVVFFPDYKSVNGSTF